MNAILLIGIPASLFLHGCIGKKSAPTSETQTDGLPLGLSTTTVTTYDNTYTAGVLTRTVESVEVDGTLLERSEYVYEHSDTPKRTDKYLKGRDGGKQLSSVDIIDGLTSIHYVIVDRDTVHYDVTRLDKPAGNVVYSRSKYSLLGGTERGDEERIIEYDTKGRTGTLLVNDHIRETKTRYSYRYENSNDTLISTIFRDNVKDRVVKKLSDNNRETEWTYNALGELTEVVCKTTDGIETVEVRRDIILNSVDSTFYKNGVEYRNEYEDPQYSSSTNMEYDTHGNITRGVSVSARKGTI